MKLTWATIDIRPVSSCIKNVNKFLTQSFKGLQDLRHNPDQDFIKTTSFQACKHKTINQTLHYRVHQALISHGRWQVYKKRQVGAEGLTIMKETI